LKKGTGIIHQFLAKKGSKAQVKVVGKAINHGRGSGIEIPCIFKLTGQLRNDDIFNKLLHIQNH